MQGVKAIHNRKLYSQRAGRYLTTAVKYALAFLAMAVLVRAQVTTAAVRPFGAGMYLALSFGGFNAPLLGALYCAAHLTAGLSAAALIAPAATAVVITAAWFAHYRLKKDAPMSMLVLYSLIAQAGYLYTAFITKQNAWDAVTTVAIGAVFVYACVTAVRTVLVKRVRFGLNKTDCACLGMVLLALGSGLVSVLGMGDTLLKAFFAAGVLTLARASGGMPAAVWGIMLGAGAAAANGHTAYMSAFAAMALAAALFGDSHRLIGAAAVVSIDIVFGLHFNAYNGYQWVDLLAVVLGASVFLLVPNAMILSIKETFGRSAQHIGARHIINRSRKQLNLKLQEMSAAFDEMQNIFRSMTGEEMPDKEAVELLCGKLPKLLCYGCAGSKSCLREGGQPGVAAAHKELIGKALKKGRINIIDIPPYLSSKCEHVNALINAVNELSESYHRQKEMSGNLNSARMLVADQFGGVAALLNNVAAAADVQVSFDADKERELAEELTYYDILCREVMLSLEGGTTYTVSLVIKSDTLDYGLLKTVVGRTLKSRMAVATSEQTVSADWRAVVLKSAPKYDIVFGAAQTPKAGNRTSGDTHSFVKIGEDKFLMALCDGMGSGESANRQSSTALSLIENFYKAGFDNHTILSSVNSMLSVGDSESFSALDVCVVDLRLRRADFIKLGAPYGAVKRKGYCEAINAGSLPLGALEDIRPASYTLELNDNDIVVLATDGITDVFGDPGAFCEFVNGAQTVNPQTLAQQTLSHCLTADKGAPHDDMTVLAARIFPLV